MILAIGSLVAALVPAPPTCFEDIHFGDDAAVTARPSAVRGVAFLPPVDNAAGGVATQRAATSPSIAEPVKPSIYSLPLKVGLDLYNGISSVPGRSHFSDGLWAGSSLAAPSVGYARWDDGRGNSARVSMGVGGMYTGAGTSLNQPVEAYWQRTVSSTTLTVGKYWLPFGSQEWEYETRPGVMLQWSGGPHTLALSTNYNTTTHRVNGYARVGRSMGKDAALGLSVGGGKGLTYDTMHDLMWGVDAMGFAGGFRFTGEFVSALAGGKTFAFSTAKIAFERLGAWKPYVGVYSWHDQAGALGSFYSQVYGVQYQLTPSTAIETAFAPTSNRRTYWLQFHTTWER